ncbi:hypothetical protein RND71_037652 [Anisodus tanguticus]|uniref:Protein phosphatase n=1 Tax=Anisodus tanguticus TaxID=243964 RepID=A0AAE1QYX2_9SOLA|nr:hypothetical protein RND71_037652 [Anisodus tanguticus]
MISTLMSRELDSNTSSASPASVSRRYKSPTVCSFITGDATSPKRMKSRTSMDEARSSWASEDNKNSTEIVRKAKHYNLVLQNSATELLLASKLGKLNSGSFYLPHPAKANTGGEDAHFICTLTQAVGVADGVGGWADLGIDAGLYARELMSHSLAAIQEEPKGSIDLIRVLEKAYVRTKAKGSSTACIVALVDGGLYAVNLGDSGFMLVRNGCVAFKSPSQQHGFNFPYQLDCNNVGDSPSSAIVFKITAAPGDVLIVGTDGLFDNLYDEDISGVVIQAMEAGLEPQMTAQRIAELAQQRAMDQTKSSPFSDGAREAGFEYHGGKLEDISVVVSYVMSN